MKIEELIVLLENEFDELEKGTLKPETNFRDLDEWSSMHALIIIALVDTELEVRITGDDLMKMETVQDLYDLIVEKMEK